MTQFKIYEISGVKTPTYPSGASNKSYVDLVSGNIVSQISNPAYISAQNISGGTIIGGLHYPADYIVYRDAETYYCRDGIRGTTLSNNTDASTLINYATSTQKSRYTFVVSGQYDISSAIYLSDRGTLDASKGATFSIKQNVDMFKIHNIQNATLKNLYIETPDEYTSNVISFISTTGQYVKHNIVDNIYVNSPDAYHSSNILYLYASGKGKQPTGGGGAVADSAIFFNKVSNIFVDNDTTDTAIKIKTDCPNSWINGNTFDNIIIHSFKYGIDFDVREVNGLDGVDANNNKFQHIELNMDSPSLVGIRNVAGSNNEFHNVTVWDWASADNPEYVLSIHASGTGTYYQSAIEQDSAKYYDSGTSTKFNWGEYFNDSAIVKSIDSAKTSSWKGGSDESADWVKIYANQLDKYPYISWAGSGLSANSLNLYARDETTGYINLRRGATDYIARFRGYTGFSDMYGGQAKLRIYPNTDDLTKYLTLFAATGVGINTATPSYDLEVADNFYATNISGGTIQSAGTISSATGLYAHFVSANASNLAGVTDVAWSGGAGFHTFSGAIADGTYQYTAISTQNISGGMFQGKIKTSGTAGYIYTDPKSTWNNSALIPSIDNSINLGTPDNRFGFLYVGSTFQTWGIIVDGYLYSKGNIGVSSQLYQRRLPGDSPGDTYVDFSTNNEIGFLAGNNYCLNLASGGTNNIWFSANAISSAALRIGPDTVITDIDTDGTFASNSDNILATQAAIKTYVDANAGGVGGATISSNFFLIGSGNSLWSWMINSGAKYTSAYVSTSTGVFALASHTHDTSGASWSGATGFYTISSSINPRWVSSQSISGGTIIGGLHYPADYVLYMDGDTCYAKRGDNGLVEYSSTGAANVLQNTFNSLYPSGGSIHITNSNSNSTYLMNKRVAISGNDNILYIGGYLTFPDGTAPINSYPNSGGFKNTKDTSTKTHHYSMFEVMGANNKILGVGGTLYGDETISNDYGNQPLHLISLGGRTCSGNTIDGIHFNGSPWSCIQMRYADNNSIINNFIDNSMDLGIGLTDTCCNNIIKGNHIHLSRNRYNEGGIKLNYKSNYNVIDNNIIDFNHMSGAGYGVQITNNASFNVLSNNIIRNGEFGRNQAGIDIQSNVYSSNSCYNNVITNMAESGYYIGSPVTIIGGEVSFISGSNSGIDTAGDDVVINGVRIHNCEFRGIWTRNCHRISVTNCHIYNNSQVGSHTGILIGGSINWVSGATVKNNFFYDNQVTPTQTTHLQTVGDLTDIIIKDNYGYVTENNGWSSVADTGTIAHGCADKPTCVQIAPSGANPIMYSFTVDANPNITVYHSDAGNYDFSWRAEV